ncbi:hypothetical protein C8N29_1299 [Agitococcus lubricus]|uniref:Uncharacterized protein n=1 Tax=Agitococcus lubricus TaxID=1077255 RepID=A0A2T5ISH3_9GAMM|nr:hypothetical protein C8N29_1299 [Agitococcus lubricus]
MFKDKLYIKNNNLYSIIQKTPPPALCYHAEIFFLKLYD